MPDEYNKRLISRTSWERIFLVWTAVSASENQLFCAIRTDQVNSQRHRATATGIYWTPWSWTAEGISTKTRGNTSHIRATNWLGFQGHGCQGQGHRNVFRRRHARRLFAAECHVVFVSLAFYFDVVYIASVCFLRSLNRCLYLTIRFTSCCALRLDCTYSKLLRCDDTLLASHS